MTKRIKYIMCIIFTFFIAKANVFAGSLSIWSGAKEVTVGQTVTVSVKANNIAGTFNVSSSNNGILAGGESGKWLENDTYTFTFTAKSAGTATITASSLDVADYDTNDKFSGSKSVSIVVKNKSTSSSSSNSNSNKGGTTADKKEYDSNNNLKSLTVDGQSIEPTFNKDTTEYKLSLDQSVEKINVQAAAESDKAAVSGTGEKTLSQGENTIEVKVTAENGNEKVYKIIVTVEDKHPISAKVGKNTYTVVKKNNNLINKLENYEEVTIKIDDQDVIAYKNNKTNVLLVILKDKDNKLAYYTYNEQTKKYEEYHYIKVGNITLQILPSTTPEKYLKDTLKIQNQTIDYYKISKKNKIGLIYGTNIKTGNTGYYVYDTEEETLSRYYNPEVKLYQKELKQLKEYTMIVIGVIALLSIIVIICSLQKGKKKKHLRTM